MRRLLATLVVLALLLVGADVATRLIAQQKISEALGAGSPSAAPPSVQVHGLSFLIQAIGGTYSHVTVVADGTTLGPIDGVALTTDLYGVHLPLSDALSGSLARFTADRADLRAVIPAAALGAAVHRPGLTLSAVGSAAVRVHTTVAVAGRIVPVTVDVGISVAGDAMLLTARSVSAAGVEVPSSVTAAVERGLTATIPLGTLPFPVGSATVAVSGGDLVVSGTATHVDASRFGAG